MRALLAAALAVLVLAPSARAADCTGADLTGLDVTAGRVRLRATVTRAGLDPAALVAGGLRLRLVDANDGAVVYTLDVAAARFRTKGSGLRYDRQGSFRGSIRVAVDPQQADTVRLEVRDPRATTANSSDDRALRLELAGAAGSCVRSCTSACTARGHGALACRPSADYVPAADQGFGARRKPARGATSALCGLALPADDGCDFLVEERCVLPFPSSQFLRPDPTTPTGLRLAYPADALPANVTGKHIDPTDWNTLDGFSPGPVIMTLFPDTGRAVDLEASGVAFHTSFARSLDAGHPTVLATADGTRVVHFAELDANTADVTRRAFIIRPGQRLDDATHYVVGIRRLVDTQGTPITPRLAFRALRDGAADAELTAACGSACAARIAARRPAMEATFASLAAAGVARTDLVLAWDFTTASTTALTGWMVAVRDQAFALGTPSFTVTSVDDGPGGLGRSATIFRRVEGTFQAPLFMTADAPGSRLNLVGGVPRQNGYATVPFMVDIPHWVLNGGGTPRPARPTLWGHGLLGTRSQIGSLSQLANAFGFVIGGVDMQGMSNPDLPAIVDLIADYSKFHRIPERLHQGFLNHLLLARLMRDPVAGLGTHPAFRFGSPAVSIIDSTEVYYSGGSQGGIFGGAIMGIAEEFDRGFLAVPAANYSTLLHRSIDFDPYLALTRGNYPDRLDEQLILALAQQLWDRAEPQGYLPHILPGTLSDPPVPHKILIHMATYDSEVSNLGTEIEVRSLGIPQLTPVHRSFFQIPEMAAPFDGSAFVEIDPQLGFSRCNVPGQANPGAVCETDADCPGVGDPPTRTRCDAGVPPLTNTAPTFNNRAHGSTSSDAAGAQISAFLSPNGRIEQFCTGPCDPQ
ncbi:MAG: hypothetical protein KIT14_22070 [bacterium]|nr:hypothetical protein [bacterium]